MAPSITSVSLIDKMERPRFYKTQGDNFVMKVVNFLFHPDNRLYLSLMLPSIFLILLGRMLMIIGFIYVLNNKAKLPLTIFLLLVTSYIFAVTGPMVNAARYRLPIEPVLITFTAVGLICIHSWWKNKR